MRSAHQREISSQSAQRTGGVQIFSVPVVFSGDSCQSALPGTLMAARIQLIPAKRGAPVHFQPCMLTADLFTLCFASGTTQPEYEQRRPSPMAELKNTQSIEAPTLACSHWILMRGHWHRDWWRKNVSLAKLLCDSNTEDWYVQDYVLTYGPLGEVLKYHINSEEK